MVDVQTMKMTINTNTGSYTSFNDVFWGFVKNQVGITHIYQEKQSYLKKAVSFEERQNKVEVLLERADFEDDKLDPNDQELIKWSDEALHLNQIIQKLGLNKDVCSEEYLYRFFKTFFAQRNSIQELDHSLMNFSNLQVLNLSNNQIKVISNVPQNLKELNLTGNQIEAVQTFKTPISSLIHLGVAYNQVKSDALAGIVRNFPALFSLDLAFNQLTDFHTTIDRLEGLDKLKMLSLAGNPLQLTNHYREIVKQRFQDLRIFDGTPAFEEQEENQKKKYRKKVIARLSHLGDIPADAFKVPKEELIPIESNVVLEIALRILDGVSGLYLNPDNCQTMDSLNLEEMPLEQKSSMYWVSYTDHTGRTMTSEKRAWLEHFMVNAETGVGRCDLDFQIRIDEPPSVELRDWLLEDCFVTLHQSAPRTVTKALSGDGNEVMRDVVLGDDGLPIVESMTLGVMRLELSKLILKAEPSKEDLDYHKMVSFFSQNLMRKPEFVYKNQLISLKDTEVEILESDLKTVEEQEKLRANMGSQESMMSKDAGKKKDAKPAKGAKGADEKNMPKSITIDYPEVESEPDFLILERSFTQMKVQAAADGKKSGMKSSQGASASAQGAAGSAAAPTQTLEQKRQARLKELKSTYDIIRGTEYKIAVITKLNVPLPPKSEEPREVSTPADNQSKMSKGGKGKGKK